MLPRLACSLLIPIVAACAGSPPAPPTADTIYRGGMIVTMDDDGSRAEALAVKDRRIVAVGTEAEVMRSRGAETKIVDLAGRAVVPGFVEGYGVLLRRADIDPNVLAAASSACARVGLTTIQEGAASPGEVRLVTDVANALRLEVDAVAFARWDGIDELHEELGDMDCVGTFRIGGVALAVDAPAEPAELAAQVRRCFEQGWHAHVTVRGAADVEQLLEAIRSSADVRPAPSPRVVAIVHTDELSSDQLAEMAALGVIPSFCATAEPSSIGLAATAARVPGLSFTLHDDAVDRLPDPLGSIAAAVAAGVPAERALRAWTRDAAFEIRMDGRKGSLAVGRLADLVILSADPTTAAPGEVQVDVTVKSGRVVYVRGG